MTRWLRLGLPLVILLLLAVVLARGLQFDPRKLPSAREGKPAPGFTLPTLADGTPFSSDALRGQVWVMNVFASWCSACVIEHPRLQQLAKTNDFVLIGMAYKDNPDDTRRWLREHGADPYRQVVVDLDGRIGIDYGVYGVPETFVIDADGVVRYRQAGPIGDDFFDQHIAPLLAIATAKPAQTRTTPP